MAQSWILEEQVTVETLEFSAPRSWGSIPCPGFSQTQRSLWLNFLHQLSLLELLVVRASSEGQGRRRCEKT